MFNLPPNSGQCRGSGRGHCRACLAPAALRSRPSSARVGCRPRAEEEEAAAEEARGKKERAGGTRGPR